MKKNLFTSIIALFMSLAIFSSNAFAINESNSSAEICVCGEDDEVPLDPDEHLPNRP